MLEWFIDLITSIITWVLALFGIDYAKMEKSEQTVELVPAAPVAPLE